MLNDILGQINDLMYTYLLLFLLLGTGLYFSIRSRFAQVRLMKEGFRTGSGLLDVGDGCNRRCFCIYRKYTGTGI